MDYDRFELGDFGCQEGGVIEAASLAYRTWGALNGSRDNAILLPSYYTGTHRSYEAMIGEGLALDPSRWFIIAVNAFGNGLSSSPSHGQPGFPHVSLADNVNAQHRLVFEELGVERLAMVGGWSMGAMQAYAWGALHPHAMDRVAAWCGSAQCWPLNQVFLEGLEAILRADLTPDRKAGLRAFGRAYAGWAYSAAFFRDALYRSIGFADLEAFLRFWEADHEAWDYRDLLAKLRTWRDAAPSRLIPGDRLEDYLGRIEARTLVMPCDNDAYFTPDECQIEAGLIRDSDFQIIKSPFGHCAGAPGRDPGAMAVIDAALKRHLES